MVSVAAYFQIYDIWGGEVPRSIPFPTCPKHILQQGPSHFSWFRRFLPGPQPPRRHCLPKVGDEGPRLGNKKMRPLARSQAQWPPNMRPPREAGTVTLRWNHATGRDAIIKKDEMTKQTPSSPRQGPVCDAPAARPRGREPGSPPRRAVLASLASRQHQPRGDATHGTPDPSKQRRTAPCKHQSSRCPRR